MPKSAAYRQTAKAVSFIAKAMSKVAAGLGYKLGKQAGESYGILDKIFNILGKVSGHEMPIADSISDSEMDTLRDAQRQYASQEEIDAVKAYSGSAYVNINSYLYGNGDKYWQKVVDKLDAVTNTPIGKDVILYRGANALDLKQLPENLQDAVGATVRFKHFASFGYDFYRSFTHKPVVYALKVPAGTNAKIITDISKFGHSESEVLMARDTDVKIERIEDTGSKIIIHGVVVGQKRHK